MTWINLNLDIHIMLQYLLFCPSVTTEEDQRGMGGAAKERKRGAGAEGAEEERERGDPCTGRIKMQMSTYILYCSYTLYQHHISKHLKLPETNQPLKASIKGIVHPKMKILSSFTHPQVVPNLYECLCSAEHKGIYFEESL